MERNVKRLKYSEPTLELIKFGSSDVITTSSDGPYEEGDVPDSGWTS